MAWPCHRDVLQTVGRDFEAVEDDVEIAAIERRNELVPLVLDHLRLDAEFGRDGFGEFELETGEDFGLLRIRKDVRRTALGIRAPKQHAALFDFVEMIRRANRESPARKQEDEDRYENHMAHVAPRNTHAANIARLCRMQ
jgi:hypothetical protein